MQLITCSAAYRVGGLGRLLAEAVERARSEGRAFRYIAGGLKPGDEALTSIVRPQFTSLLSRLPPWRLDASRRQMLIFDSFDRAAARRIEPGVESVLAFAGQALHTFRRARRAGAERLQLLSPTAHVQRVRKQHRLAYADYPIERDWLGDALMAKTLAEYELADEILVPSEYALRSFRAEGVPASKLTRISLHADARFCPALLREPDGIFRVVFTGALTVVKGVPLLIDALSRLPKLTAELTLVGGSGSQGMRRLLQQRMRADPRIRIAPGDPLPHLQRADLYVHPSYQDGFAYAVAEAIACGVPAIVTEDTGARELITGGASGWIVPTGDVDALFERLAACTAAVGAAR